MAADTDFHLIDLLSQAAAVQSLLHGKAAGERLAWLSRHGSLVPFRKRTPGEHQVYLFETHMGFGCAFLLDGGKFVFVGDHATFTVE